MSAVGLAGSLGLLSACNVGDAKPLPLPAATKHYADSRADMEYAPQSAAQRLDLSVPEGDRPSPLVILVHAGGWQNGNKADFGQDTVTALNKAGYAVASINYRLSSEARWPAGVRDAKAAVRWLRAHAGDYHLDPDRFAILGSSAGGYLAAAVGLTGDDQDSEFNDPELGNPQVSSAVQAVVLWSAPTDFRAMDKELAAAGCAAFTQLHGLAGSPESRWLGETVSDGGQKVRQSNLLRYVSDGGTRPPFQIVHGTADCTIPPAQSRNLNSALRQAGSQSTLSLVKGMKHDEPKFTKRLVKAAIKYLDSKLT